MKKRILMIEDGRGLATAVRDRLESVGYDFDWAADGPSGLEKARAGSWDLILIDLMLPLLPGDQIVKRLRDEGVATPLILVTAKDQPADRVAGLRGGADDYIVKPFHFDEFLARVEAHLRRGPGTPESPGAPAERTWLNTQKPDFAFGELTLRFKTGQLLKNSEPVSLSHQEFRLLCLFASHPGEVLGTERLLREAWDYQAMVTSRTVYVHVAWLRKKLRSAGKPDGFITTVRGIGYVFEP
jgi:two-component system alkaline phosphatase synthesis response regulator PhoP